jgi:hypothetical protein
MGQRASRINWETRNRKQEKGWCQHCPPSSKNGIGKHFEWVDKKILRPDKNSKIFFFTVQHGLSQSRPIQLYHSSAY